MRTFALCCFFGTAVTACATTEGPKLSFQQSAEAWVGKPETELLSKKGQASKTTIRAYEDGQFIEKTVEYEGAAATGRAGAAGVRYRSTMVNGQWIQLPEQSVADGAGRIECKLRFKLDQSNIVTGWSAEGKDCK